MKQMYTNAFVNWISLCVHSRGRKGTEFDIPNKIEANFGLFAYYVISQINLDWLYCRKGIQVEI